MNLKQLSQHLGLSQTTVSRALNGYPEVSEKTRLRVLEAARRLGYSPNLRAKGLATGRTMVIGHVIPVTEKHDMVNPVFGDFLAGAGDSYRRAGFDMLISMVDDADQESVYRALQSRGQVDGLILHGPKMRDPRIALLQELGLPFVVHGRASHMGGGYAWVDMDNRRAFDRATDLLISMGHRRIALINGQEQMDFAFRRREGYVAALTRAGLTPDPAIMRNDEMTETLGHRAARAMLRGPNPPTAFLAASIIIAIGIRRAIEEHGLQMGRDVSVITHDDCLSYLPNGGDAPVFTATRSSVREAGRICANLVIDMIQKGTPPAEHLLEAQLVLGRSTGPANAHAMMEGRHA